MKSMHVLRWALCVALAAVSVCGTETVSLWPKGHAALKGLDSENVPELSIHSPAEGVKSANMILIICPGGGYGHLTMGDEGHSVAAWYATQGITGVVLKYRLPKKGKWTPKKDFSPLHDAQRAVQTLRHRSKEMGMPGATIGILGFSAGGHLSCMTATRWREGQAGAQDPIEALSSRPDFACLIYPVISFMDHGHGGSRTNLLGEPSSEKDRKMFSGEYNVSKKTPPIFMVHANDDGVKPENSFVFYQALRKEGLPAEMHIVSRGGHGFFNRKGWGIPDKAPLRFSRAGGMWPVWTLDWMLEEKLVTNPKQWVWSERRLEVKTVVDP